MDPNQDPNPSVALSCPTKKPRSKRGRCKTPLTEQHLSFLVIPKPPPKQISHPGRSESITRKPRSKRGHKYKCKECHKRFRTYQALGGHKTSHRNKNKETNHNNVIPTLNPSRRFDHICSICGRTFDSGQALGGHKRVHHDEKIAPLSKKRPFASSEQGQFSGKKIFRLKKQQISSTKDSNGDKSLSLGQELGGEKKLKCEKQIGCGRSFDSGQALGGHKRVHHEEKIGPLYKTPFAASEQGQFSGKKRFRFKKQPISSTKDSNGDKSLSLGQISGNGGEGFIRDFDINRVPESEPELKGKVEMKYDSKINCDENPMLPFKKRSFKRRLICPFN